MPIEGCGTTCCNENPIARSDAIWPERRRVCDRSPASCIGGTPDVFRAIGEKAAFMSDDACDKIRGGLEGEAPLDSVRRAVNHALPDADEGPFTECERIEVRDGVGVAAGIQGNCLVF